MFRIDKVWEKNNVKDYFDYIFDINDFESFILENDFISICQCDTYVPRQEEGRKFCLDADCDLYNFSYVYTDSQHPIACFDYGYFGYGSKETFEILINSEFYSKYKDEISSCLKKKILLDINNLKPVIRIPDIIIDDELLSLLEQRQDELRDSLIVFYAFDNDFNIDLSLVERFNKQDKLADEKLSDSKYNIGEYTVEDLIWGMEFEFDCMSLTAEEINNFKYLNKYSKIAIPYSSNDNISWKIYIEKLLVIFKILELDGRIYHIDLNLYEPYARDLAIEMGLLNFNNIYLNIYGALGDDYTKERLLEQNVELENLVKDIRESNLSPYEKYLAVYNIVKNFKPYKEEGIFSANSRTITGILNTDFMVCVGFSLLLNVLLHKVGIPSYKIGVKADTSYDKGFTMEEKSTELGAHARNIVKIDDDKYGIHGIFVADATWDNNMESDFYNNCHMTFDRKKEAYRLEQLADEDLLLDFHNMDEFNDKLNFLLNREIKKKKDIVDGFYSVYSKILRILSHLDHNKYLELYNRYNVLVSNKINNYRENKISLSEIENIFVDFISEYANYIIPLSNKEISNDIFLRALAEVKRKIDKVDELFIDGLLKDISTQNQERAKYKFPYVYNPNAPRPNYLDAPDESVFLPENRKRS